MTWLNIPRETYDAETESLNRRLVSGDLCKAEVDGIPGACVRPPGHEPADSHYRLPFMSEA